MSSAHTAESSAGTGSSSTSQFKPPKTTTPLKNEVDYTAWAKEMSRALRVAELDDAIHTTKGVAPTPMSREFQNRTDKALTTLMVNCEPEPLALIRVCDTALDAWNILKSHYEGRTRTHMSSLLLSITNLRFDDRKETLTQHIINFENKWNNLRTNVASTAVSSDTLAGSIKHFINNDGWKATMLLSTLPHLPIYQNLIMNITGGTAEPSYADIALRLRELSDHIRIRPSRSLTNAPEPATAFATNLPVKCHYCKSKGWPGTSHEEKTNVKEFQILTGRLLYIARMWRPDIRYAVQRLSIVASSPTTRDFKRAHRVISYLLGSKTLGIRLREEDMTDINIYTDAGEEALESKATSGILIIAGESPVGWASRKQDVTTLSSTEAEFIAMGVGAQDALWMQKILEFCNIKPRIRLWTDSKGGSNLSYNPDFHKRTKHIRRRHHFVRECVEEGLLSVDWVPSEENPADMLTKCIVGDKFKYLISKAGMKAQLAD